MTNTNTAPKVIYLKGRALRNLRRTCAHGTTIELADGTRVCTQCEVVLR